MKFRDIAFILILFICFYDQSAQSIKNKVNGKVTDFKSGEPLIGVNIYINNSTIGTTTNKEGYYELLIPDGRFEIVFSMIGFQPESKFIFVNNGSDRLLDITLREKVYEMDQVQIEDRFSEEWFKKLSVFKKYLLGQNDFSSLCRIENEKDIFFSGEYSSIFNVHSYNPIKIRNDALGYLMECTIINFEIDNKNTFCTYSLKTRFIDISDEEKTNKVIQMVNRSRAYVGSLRHFLYSAITTNNFSNFDVALVKRTDYKEKGISVKSGSEIIKTIGENPDYLLSFNGLLRVRYRYNIDFSWLKLSENDSYINYNGYLVNPLSVIQYGKWAFDGLSKLLPLDYISF
jgi:hypothetical protein